PKGGSRGPDTRRPKADKGAEWRAGADAPAPHRDRPKGGSRGPDTDGPLMPKTWTWTDVTARLAAEPRGTRLRLPRPPVEPPLDGGLRRGVDLPVGQRADFRLPLGDRTLCVQDFGSHYEAFLSEAAVVADEAAVVADEAAAAPD